jgi:hypothetical protein
LGGTTLNPLELNLTGKSTAIFDYNPSLLGITGKPTANFQTFPPYEGKNEKIATYFPFKSKNQLKSFNIAVYFPVIQFNHSMQTLLYFAKVLLRISVFADLKELPDSGTSS